MINYPKSLDTIFHKLYTHNILPVIVGGYIRDALLGIPSNDIDIELYGVSSLDKVEEILQEFGKVNSVGKSFGVCKMYYKNLDLDFSLPREDNKIASGHQGFAIKIYKNLDFKTAALRRDFTINAIGYDVVGKKILDPYHGREDLDKKILRSVDKQKFKEDPLRVLRAVVFASRFRMKLDKILVLTCKEMIKEKLLEELPKERVFQELQKLLLKSDKPSLGFNLLKELGAFSFFRELAFLNGQEYKEIFNSLDMLKQLSITNDKEFVILALTVITSKFSTIQTQTFLQRVTNEKTLIKKVLQLHTIDFDLDDFNDYDIYKLAQKTDIAFYAHYLHVTQKKKKDTEYLLKKAKKLNVLHKPIPPLVSGKDLIELGLQPSKEFSKILQSTYQAQIQNIFNTKSDALIWLQKNLLS
ncbi:CCA tRNA nucleotidyltransferase [Sulfurimonas sp. NWX367]|uniref:CCA tRNA nucleotidyltransferase n=1 Tax=Sulfurimonas sp. NWX367 TaxID=2925413 RepID=UPI003204E618